MKIWFHLEQIVSAPDSLAIILAAPTLMVAERVRQSAIKKNAQKKP